MIENKKKYLVIIVGAGGTVSEVANKKATEQPPLDGDFYKNCFQDYKIKVQEVSQYFKKYYHYSILDKKHDSLEKTLSTIYTDLFDPKLKKEASSTIMSLIKLFNKRLADSTNKININPRRQLYRIVIKYLMEGYTPKRISFITFNQDIQIEKTLNYINSTKRWKELQLFSFPKCYDLNLINKPTAPFSLDNCFDLHDYSSKIKVYKLHGSINWYSAHQTSNFKPDIFTNTTKEFTITRRKKINTDMKYGISKKSFTFPVIIPPVTNKSAIMNKHLISLWEKAAIKLEKANEIIFWGYSLPDLDFESKNLFQKKITGNKSIDDIILINPDSTLCSRYIDILGLKKLDYFRDANSFLSKKLVNFY